MRLLLVVAVASPMAFAAAGCGSSDEQGQTSKSVTTNPGGSELLPDGEADGEARQADWENQAGEDWDAFLAGFEDGFSTGCGQLFDLSHDVFLYYGDDEFQVEDCQALDPGDPESAGAEVPGDVPDAPESEGYDLGVEAGCSALFEDEGVDTLYYEGAGFTADDCLGGGSGGSTSPPGGEDPPADEQQGADSPPATREDYGPEVGADTWGSYSKEKKRAVAALFVSNNPSDCKDVDPAQLAKSVDAGYGDEFPFAEPVKSLLLNYCKVIRGLGE